MKCSFHIVKPGWEEHALLYVLMPGRVLPSLVLASHIQTFRMTGWSACSHNASVLTLDETQT